MDLSIEIEDYKLNIRAGCIIVHNDKVLLHHNQQSNHYALLGGRVKIGESSEETIKREIKEELGKEIIIQNYIATIENFFTMKNQKYHEILFIYQAEFTEEEDKQLIRTLQNIEGEDYLQYEWIDLDNIDKCPLKPESFKEILKKRQFPVHRINQEY